MRLRHDESLFYYLLSVIVASNAFEANLRLLAQNTLPQLGLKLTVVLASVYLIIQVKPIQAYLTLVSLVELKLSSLQNFLALSTGTRWRERSLVTHHSALRKLSGINLGLSLFCLSFQSIRLKLLSL